MSSWIQEPCTCGAINWLFDGDPSDETRPDIEGFLCHRCKLANPMFEDELGDPSRYVIGLESPPPKESENVI